VTQVTVGGTAGKVFTPTSIMAAVGDMIQFDFKSTNHTLTQSTFPLPCAKMAGGKDSGFMPNPNDSMNPAPMFMVQVMDTKPACKLHSDYAFANLAIDISQGFTASRKDIAVRA